MNIVSISHFDRESSIGLVGILIMENWMVFYFLKMISDKFNYFCDRVIFGVSYYFGELHKRLTMSSTSSQVSSSELAGSPKFRSTLTSHRANELQEVVSCTKETVRITPPPQDAVALRPTILTFENNYPNGTIYRTNYLKNVPARVADKQCQTDDMSGAGDSNKDQCSEITVADTHCQQNAPEEKSTTADFISNEKQEENRTRELDHINVIVTECPQIETESAPPITKAPELETKDTVDNKVVINVKPLSKDEEQIKEEDDSCCVKCFLVTLQCCDCCVIL